MPSPASSALSTRSVSSASSIESNSSSIPSPKARHHFYYSRDMLLALRPDFIKTTGNTTDPNFNDSLTTPSGLSGQMAIIRPLNNLSMANDENRVQTYNSRKYGIVNVTPSTDNARPMIRVSN